MKINIFEEILKLVLIGFIIIIISKLFFNKEKFAIDAPQTDAEENLGDIIVDNLTASTIDIFPKGIVAAWAGTDIPNGWIICDGKNNTPDLSNRFIFGQGDGPSLTSRKLGDMSGNETHTLTINELGKHTHYFDSQTNTVNVFTDVDSASTYPTTGLTQNIANTNTGDTGGNLPHNNMPPYYVLAFIMKN